MTKNYYATTDIKKGDLLHIDFNTGNVFKVVCSHENFLFRGTDLPGTVYCADCNQTVDMVEAFNNLIERVRRLCA